MPAEEKARAVERRMKDPKATTLEKTLALIAGVAEGFSEQSRAADLPGLAGEAVDKVKETGRALRDGFAPPHAPGAIPLPGVGAEDRGANELGHMGAEGETADATDNASHRLEALTRKAERVTGAVGEAADRASRAPAAIAHEIRTTTRAIARDLQSTLIGFAIAGLFAVFTLALVTWGLVVFLNGKLGGHWGVLAVAVMYVIVAIIAYFVARAGIDRASAHAREGVIGVKREAKDVVAPLRDIGSY